MKMHQIPFTLFGADFSQSSEFLVSWHLKTLKSLVILDNEELLGIIWW